MQIQPYTNTQTTTTLPTHSHSVAEPLDEKTTGSLQSNSTNAPKPSVENRPSRESTEQMAEEAKTSIFQSVLSSGKEALVKFWGPSKSELEAEAQKAKVTEEDMAKLSPYKENLPAQAQPSKLFTRAKVKVIDLATNLFHFMSGKSFSSKKEQKREKQKPIVIENVKLDLHSQEPINAHLMDSYNRSGAYASLSTNNTNTDSSKQE